MPRVTFDEWKAFVRAQPDAHLLQTAEWGELKSAFGWRVVRLIRAGAGAQILFRVLPFGLSVGYAPKVSLDDPVKTAQDGLWAEVDEICREQRAIFCKFEPNSWQNPPLPEAGLTVRGRNIQPPRTILVDLTGNEDDILARMKQKTRYNIRLAEKKGVSVRAWNDLPAFYQMMRTTGGRDGFAVHSQSYYERAYQLFQPGGRAELLVAEFEGRPLAALMVFAHGERAWYVYGASTDEERNRMPTYLLQWEAMRWAKERGCREYDLWGVPDESEETLEAHFETRKSGLWGVYRFKRGFGGKLVRAADALDRVYFPFIYKIYLLRATAGDPG